MSVMIICITSSTPVHVTNDIRIRTTVDDYDNRSFYVINRNVSVIQYRATNVERCQRCITVCVNVQHNVNDLCNINGNDYDWCCVIVGWLGVVIYDRERAT